MITIVGALCFLHDILVILFVKNQLWVSFIECREVADAAVTMTTMIAMIAMFRKGNTGDDLVPGEDVRNGEKNLNVNVLNPKKQCDPIVRSRTNGQEKKKDAISSAISIGKSTAKSSAKNGSL